jgi:hypothetical protein
MSDFKKMKIVSFLPDSCIHTLRSNSIIMYNISKMYLGGKEKVKEEKKEKEESELKIIDEICYYFY